jgi:hypothetical protein
MDCRARLSQGIRTCFGIAIVIGDSCTIERLDGALGRCSLANAAFSASDRTGRRLVVKTGCGTFRRGTSSAGYRIDFGVNLSLHFFDLGRAWARDANGR